MVRVPLPYIVPEESFDSSTLEDVGERRGIRNIVNLEKALWALEYMNQLSDAGLDFILKGGTAVQLVTEPSWPRFSVDVDICTDTPVSDLEGVLSSIDGRFDDGFSFEERISKRLSRDVFRSYRVKTPPIDGNARTILLDAYLTKPAFRSRPTAVRSFFYTSDRTVTTPTVGCLVGDKMTIVAPDTVGRVLVDSRQGVEYTKHIFDIHRLLRTDPEPSDVTDTFRMVAHEQSTVRGGSYRLEDIVEDVTRTCQVISTLNLPQDWTCSHEPDLPMPLARMRRLFRRGVRDFRAFLASDVAFGPDELVTAAGEVALIVNSLPSKDEVGAAIDEITGEDLWRRSTRESREIIDGSDDRIAWSIDHRAGLYSRNALSIWSEVVRVLEER
jgi:hypothetical protein